MEKTFWVVKTFWEETIDALKDAGKTFDDVEWIGGDDFEISKENFKRISNFIYDDGYGGQEVAEDIKLVGKDFIMKRWEYDGSEGWEFISTKPTGIIKEINSLAESEAEIYWSDKGYDDVYFLNNRLKTLNEVNKNWNKKVGF